MTVEEVRAAESGVFVWQFREVTFHEGRWQLEVDGRLVEVERKPLELLGCLLRHCGEVMTKDELLDAVWPGQVVVEAALTNAIGKLRKALDPAGDAIVTVPRVGYRLDGQVQRKAVASIPKQSRLSVGDAVPRRPNWVLDRTLDSSGEVEVWLGHHTRTGEQRVFKLSLDGSHLGALKREVTISRVLTAALGGRDDILRVIDWDFEDPPYFIESEWAGEDLLQWSERMSFASLPIGERLGLFLAIARAVAAAHSAGVLHKDLKPSNVLVEESANRRVRLADFGSGGLLSPQRLEEMGITQLGFTRTVDSGMSGTPMYLAPEILTGSMPTTRSDVYSLGIMLYQIVVGDLRRPLTSGWEGQLTDRLLIEDIAGAVHGDPEQRTSSVDALVRSINLLDDRRQQEREAEQLRQQVARSEQALRAAKARRPWMIAALVALLVGVAATGLYALEAQRAAAEAVAARAQADSNLAISEALNRFLTRDLVGQARPEASGKAQLTVAEAITQAESKISERFSGSPVTEAAVRASLATLYTALFDYAAAEQQARKAIQLYAATGPQHLSREAIVAGGLARVLSYQSRFDEAHSVLRPYLDSESALEASALAELRLQECRVLMSQGRYQEAVSACQAATLAANTAAADNDRMYSIRQNFGMAQLYSGDAAGAMESLEEAVELAVAIFGRDHLATLNPQRYLIHAKVVNQEDARQEANALVEKFIEIQGPDAVDVATARVVAADAHYAFGDFDKAVVHYDEYVRIVAEKVPDAPDRVMSLMAANEARRYTGPVDAAVAGLEEAEREAARLLEPKNPFNGQIAFSLAMAYLDAGRLDDAKTRRARLSNDEDASGWAITYWPVRFRILDGRIRQAEGDIDGARKLYAEALALFKDDITKEPDFVAAKQVLDGT